jgi:hypothetical protein
LSAFAARRGSINREPTDTHFDASRHRPCASRRRIDRSCRRV